MNGRTFWFALGTGFLVLASALFWIHTVRDAELAREVAALQRISTSLEALAGRAVLPSRADATDLRDRRQQALEGLTHAVAWLAAVGAASLERRWVADGVPVERPTEVAPWHQQRVFVLRRQMAARAAPFEALIVDDDAGPEPVVDFPCPGPDIAAFYRRWWAMESVLLTAVAPAAKRAAARKRDAKAAELWELRRLRVEEPRERDAHGGLIRVSLELQMRVDELADLTRAISEMPALSMPHRLRISMLKEDPPAPVVFDGPLKVHVPRPPVLVRLALDVVDIRPEALLARCRVHWEALADDAALQRCLARIERELPQQLPPAVRARFDAVAFAARLRRMLR